jgi:hypothetical protein
MAVLPNIEQQLREMQAALAAANAKVAALESAPAGKITAKVSQKGAISFYGMGRFPVTMYVEQFERFIKIVPQVEAWIKTNPTSRFDADGKRVSTGGTVVGLSRQAA